MSTTQTESQSPRTLRETWIALAGLSAVFLFEMLDNSILNVALPTIGRDPPASTTPLPWGPPPRHARRTRAPRPGQPRDRLRHPLRRADRGPRRDGHRSVHDYAGL